MAYTKEPSGDEVADSPEDDVRKSSRLGPLLVSWRWMLVCGALGNGNDISTGACGASPLVSVAAIAWC